MQENDAAKAVQDLSHSSYSELEQMARQVLDSVAFHYISAGSGSEEALHSNWESFGKWRLVPRVMRDVRQCSLSTVLLGFKLPAPLLLAPAGAQKMINPQGEVATARAAASSGVPLVLSNYASSTIEEVASVMGDSPKFFELYGNGDKELMRSLVIRAEKAGYSALVLTADQGGRYVRYGFVRENVGPALENHVNSIYFSDPVFRSRLSDSPEKNPREALQARRALDENATFTWDDVKFLKGCCRLPIILKGVVSPDDAELAIDYGLDGIIVSNFGGRRLEGQVAALDALPEISAKVNGRIPVLFDSGVRSGVDLIKALCLGADAVMVGRAYLYGLAVGGEKGVSEVIRKTIDEAKSALGICGCNSVDELDSSFLKNSLACEHSQSRRH